MARSAADATRFTATGPHAYSRGTASTVNISSTPPPNETPQQKVARLREAARQARLGQESTIDKVVRNGRRWADRGHKITVTALIGLGVISTGIAVYATADMMLYNRRKRREWFTEQQAKYDQALARARIAEAEGTLTPDLSLVLNKERAIEQAEGDAKKKKGLWQGAKDWVFGGLAKTERPGGKIAFTSEEADRLTAILSTEASKEVTSMTFDTSKVPSKPLDGRRQQLAHGGSLDQMGEQTARSIQRTTKSWTDWIRGR